MKRTASLRFMGAALLAFGVVAGSSVGKFSEARAQDLEPVEVAYCVKVFSLFAVPFAVSKVMGFDKEEGIDLQMRNVNSGGDCVTFVSTGTIDYAWAGIEPAAAMLARGGDILNIYNTYQGNTMQIVVPEDSPIHTLEGLRDKKVGVANMTALGTIVGRGMLKGVGLEVGKDVTFVQVGATNVAAQFLQDREVDALCIGSSQHARISNTVGPKLRPLPAPLTENAPSIGLVTRKDYFEAHKDQALALARMLTKASIFVTHDPEKAVRLMYNYWPQTRPIGKDVEKSVREDAQIVRGRFDIWRPSTSGREYWGEMVFDKAQDYLDRIAEWGIIDKPVKIEDLSTNELIEAANQVDTAAIIKRTDEHKVE